MAIPTDAEKAISNMETLRIRALDGAQLLQLGSMLDERPPVLRGQTVAMALARALLKVRTRDGRTARLNANPAQRLFEERRGRQNIVLKARQMGMTTWTAARFFEDDYPARHAHAAGGAHPAGG